MDIAGDPLALVALTGVVCFVIGGCVAWLLLRKRPKALPTSAPAPQPSPTPLPKSEEPVPIQEARPEQPEATAPQMPKWRERLVLGLKRTHGQIFRSLDEMLLSKDAKISRDETLETLFESLVQADTGVSTSEQLVNSVRSRLKAEDSLNSIAIRNILKEEILNILRSAKEPEFSIESNPHEPHVVLMVGVNGVGKTTTTGKLAYKAKLRNETVAIGAADTFRAAAVDQLRIWAERSNANFVELKEGSDPASVAFEAVKVARAQGAKLCLVDTAGRLHNRQDLMAELSKVKRVMSKEVPNAPHEVLLVLDATTGQNALQQARVFRDLVDITGLVLTKLDGTAKGGVAIAVVNELKIPIRYIGVGESVEDLQPFSAQEFVDALFED
jgi:fused signal recognition particle receptor